MSRIPGEVGSRAADQRPAGPGPPAPQFPPRLVHPIGVVLKMDPRVPHENIRRRPGDEPSHRRVGQRPRTQHRIALRQVGAEGAVETKHRPRRATTRPQGLSVFEANQVKIRATSAIAKRVQRAPVELGPRRRQMGTRRQREGHPACRDAERPPGQRRRKTPPGKKSHPSPRKPPFIRISDPLPNRNPSPPPLPLRPFVT